MGDAFDTPVRPGWRGLAVRWMPVALWLGVIFAFSSLPGSSVPPHFSVQGHLGEYAVLGGLVALALRPRPASVRAILLALALCSVYAVSDELHQALVPGRTPDILDWALDTVGTAAGLAATVAALRAVAARRRPS